MKNFDIQNESDIEIRAASLNDVKDIATIHLKCWQINYKGIIDQTFLDNLKIEDRIKARERVLKEDPCIQLVALYKNKIVGFADAGNLSFRKNQLLSDEQRMNRHEPGEVYAIYIDPDYQHRGLGSKLFNNLRQRLSNEHLTPFILWSFKNNKLSCKFYDKEGGKAVDEAPAKRGDHEYIEVAYRFEH